MSDFRSAQRFVREQLSLHGVHEQQRRHPGEHLVEPRRCEIHGGARVFPHRPSDGAANVRAIGQLAHRCRLPGQRLQPLEQHGLGLLQGWPGILAIHPRLARKQHQRLADDGSEFRAASRAHRDCLLSGLD